MKIFFALLVVVGISWNLRAFRGIERDRANALNQVSAAAVLPPIQSDAAVTVPWSLLEQTQYAVGEKPRFPAALQALNGQRASITGAVFSIKALEQNGKTRGALLMPPTKINCCGVACANDPRTMLFVSCPHQPIALPQGRFTATLTGRLKLSSDDGAWGLFTLEDAELTTLNTVAGAHP